MPVEDRLAGAVEPAVLRGRAASLQELGAQHGRGGEGDDQRDDDGGESVTANSRKSRPTMPPISRMGMKTAISEMHMERTVKPISREPSMAA